MFMLIFTKKIVINLHSKSGTLLHALVYYDIQCDKEN